MVNMEAIVLALSLNLFDLISGFVGAIKNKDIKSSKLRDGMFKKVGFIFCYMLAYILDTEGNAIGFSVGVKLLPIIITYVCVTEVVSILENISKINSDLLPEILKDLFRINKGE
jgi:toxin secretion/phage lysis holin